MTVDDWVLEAVEKHGRQGANLREVQRYIDEHHYEELAVDTLETSLSNLGERGKLSQRQDKWFVAKRTSKEDALKQLFGEA